MKNLFTAAACSAVVWITYSSASLAQAPADAPGAGAAPAVAAVAPAAPQPRPAERGRQRAWTWADARVCLEFANNLQVIRCAEKYRYKRVPI